MRLGFVLVWILSGFAGVVSAQTTWLEFDFSGSDPSLNLPWTQTVHQASSLEQDGWTAGAGIFPQSGSSNSLLFEVESGSTLSTLSEALSDQEYGSLTLRPAPGEVLDLNGQRIRFGVQRESWHAPMRYAVFSSVDGFTEGAELFTTESMGNGHLGEQTFTFILPLSGFGAISNALELRWVPYENRYSGHPTSLTSFRISSTTNVYSFTLSAGSGGSVHSTPAARLFEEGETLQLQATPDPGYRFDGWSGHVQSQLNPATVTVTGNTVVTGSFAALARPMMDVGMNIESINDWSETWFFLDQFKSARTWRTQNAYVSGPWSTGYAVPTDSQGWPTHAPFTPSGTTTSQVPHTVIGLLDPRPHTFRFQGTGSMQLQDPAGSWTFFTGTGGWSTSVYHSGQTGLHFLRINTSSSNDPIRDIQMMTPGQSASDPTAPFHPAFLDSLNPFRNIRFMDWMKTNGQTLSQWSERTRVDNYTQSEPTGVALELIIELCNQAEKDPWICVPHAADDQWVREAARLFRDTLDSHLVLYIEYSNETWNSAPAFSQTTYVQDQGVAASLSADRWQAGHMYTVKRSSDIFRIFREEYGAEAGPRLCFVLAAHASNPDTARRRIQSLANPAVNPVGIQPDALAIAPYFGVNFTPNDIPPVQPGYPTVDEILDTIAVQEIAAQRPNVQSHKALANQQGMRLICYEGGQHFIGHLGAENDTNLVQILFQANRDPRMGARYREYLDMLREEGVDLFSNFSFVGSWSKWGTWTVLEYQQQPIDQAPKMQAIQDWQQANPYQARLNIEQTNGWPVIYAHLPAERTFQLQHSSHPGGTWTHSTPTTHVRGRGIVEQLHPPEPTAETGFWRLIDQTASSLP